MLSSMLSIRSRRPITNFKMVENFMKPEIITNNTCKQKPVLMSNFSTLIKYESSIAEAAVSGHIIQDKFIEIGCQSFFCKDSRGNEENFGAAAGDFGEFLLAMDCFQRLNTGKLVVEECFEKWLEYSKCSLKRPFYLHTDRFALDRVNSEMGRNLKLKDPLELVDPHERAAFLNIFLRDGGEFQGCGHLRLLMASESEYQINCLLLKDLVRAFFKFYWKADPRLKFKIYETIQDGKALAIIHGDPNASRSVLSIQSNASGQVFILNQHAVSLYRKNFLVPFFVGLNANVSANDLFECMETKGWRNAMKTAKALAKGKPIYTVNLESK